MSKYQDRLTKSLPGRAKMTVTRFHLKISMWKATFKSSSQMAMTVCSTHPVHVKFQGEE